MSYRKHVALTLGQHWATVVWLWCDGLFIQLGHVTYIITFYPFVCQSIRIIYLLVIYLLLIYILMRASLPVPFPIPSVFCSVLWSSFVYLVFCYCLCLSYDISSYYIYSMKITERNPKNSNEKRKTKTKSKKCKNGEREYFFESQNNVQLQNTTFYGKFHSQPPSYR